jgi:hypothetical protein
MPALDLDAKFVPGTFRAGGQERSRPGIAASGPQRSGAG